MRVIESAVLLKTCRCGEPFETIRPRRRLCGLCRSTSYFGTNNPEKQASDETRRKLPSLTATEVMEHIRAGRRWFTNGGTRWRYVTGLDGIFVYYENGRYTTALLASNFAKWAKGAYANKGGKL